MAFTPKMGGHRIEGYFDRKKKKDFSPVEFFHYEEGRCIQCMHIGS